MIPLGLLALELLSRRFLVLGDARVRFRLMLIGAIAFAAMLGVVTWQALIGESIVRPSVPILAAGVATVAGAVGAIAAVLFAAARTAPPLR